ncbi:MAG: hypothetical protein KF681_08505 [Bdellovibrionaceae bacterium]|nr:hypothetical protein [Pseudobdellovibrionaceae bacterium]
MSEPKEQVGFFEGIFQAIRDRFSSPFFGSFFISWCIINWPIPVFLVFGGEASRNAYISEYVFGTSDAKLVYFPFAIALGYSFAVPIITFFYRKYLSGIAQREARVQIWKEQDLEYSRQYYAVPKELFSTIRTHAATSKLVFDDAIAALRERLSDGNPIDHVEFIRILESARDRDEKILKYLAPFPEGDPADPLDDLFRFYRSKEFITEKLREHRLKLFFYRSINWMLKKI